MSLQDLINKRGWDLALTTSPVSGQTGIGVRSGGQTASGDLGYIDLATAKSLMSGGGGQPAAGSSPAEVAANTPAAIKTAGVDVTDFGSMFQAALPTALTATGAMLPVGAGAAGLLPSTTSTAKTIGLAAGAAAAGAGAGLLVDALMESGEVGVEQAVTQLTSNLPFTPSGPGVPEPPQAMVAKQWVILVHANDIGNYYVYFFKLLDGRITCYNPRLQEWKIWRPKKNIVISSNPRISQIAKLERTYNKVIRRLAKKSKALKLSK